MKHETEDQDQKGQVQDQMSYKEKLLSSINPT